MNTFKYQDSLIWVKSFKYKKSVILSNIFNQISHFIYKEIQQILVLYRMYPYDNYISCHILQR